MDGSSLAENLKIVNHICYFFWQMQYNHKHQIQNYKYQINHKY